MNENEIMTTQEAGVAVRDIEVITEEILFFKQQAGAAILEIGLRLMEAKQALPHGEWLPWLKEKVDFSERTAQRFMKVAEGYGKSDTVTLLGTRKALALLALEPDEREEFLAETHLVDGAEKSAVDMTAAELEAAIRERDEARKREEEARAKAEAAEQARAKMETDMAFLKERVEGLNDEVAAQEEAARQAEEELERLRKAPIDVAVEQADPAQLEEAREAGAKEAREELEKALAEAKEKAAKELADAREKEKAAKEKLKELKSQLEQAQQVADTARKDAEKAKKEAMVAGNEELATFKVLFAGAQDTVNKMADLLKKLDGDGRSEDAGKLRKALGALAQAVGKVAAC